MSAPYTLDDFTRDVSAAVAKDVAARKAFIEAVIRAVRAAREGGVRIDEAILIAFEAVETLREAGAEVMRAAAVEFAASLAQAQRTEDKL